MKREPQTYIPSPAKAPIWPMIKDALAAIGAFALVCAMILLTVEAALMMQCAFGGRCD